MIPVIQKKVDELVEVVWNTLLLEHKKARSCQPVFQLVYIILQKIIYWKCSKYNMDTLE